MFACLRCSLPLWVGWKQKTPSQLAVMTAWPTCAVDTDPVRACQHMREGHRSFLRETYGKWYLHLLNARYFLKKGAGTIYHSAASGTEKWPACTAAWICSSVKPISLRMRNNSPIVWKTSKSYRHQKARKQWRLWLLSVSLWSAHVGQHTCRYLQ